MPYWHLETKAKRGTKLLALPREQQQTTTAMIALAIRFLSLGMLQQMARHASTLAPTLASKADNRTRSCSGKTTHPMPPGCIACGNDFALASSWAHD